MSRSYFWNPWWVVGILLGHLLFTFKLLFHNLLLLYVDHFVDFSPVPTRGRPWDLVTRPHLIGQVRLGPATATLSLGALLLLEREHLGRRGAGEEVLGRLRRLPLLRLQGPLLVGVDASNPRHLLLGLQLGETVVVYKKHLADHVALLRDVVFYILVLTDFFIILELIDIIVLLRKSVKPDNTKIHTSLREFSSFIS